MYRNEEQIRRVSAPGMLHVSTGKYLQTFEGSAGVRHSEKLTLRHSVTSQKTRIFSTTFLRNSNLTRTLKNNFVSQLKISVKESTRKRQKERRNKKKIKYVVSFYWYRPLQIFQDDMWIQEWMRSSFHCSKSAGGGLSYVAINRTRQLFRSTTKIN